MATKASISVSQSRFAALKVEDDDSDVEQEEQPKSVEKQSLPSVGGKKRNKKKKKAAILQDSDLRNLAFGKPSGRPQDSNHGENSCQPQRSNSDQWEEWRQKDEEVVQESYEKDLEQALMLSKIEFEQQKVARKEAALNPDSGLHFDSKEGKKKKRKDKPQAMSLEEFNNLGEEKEKHISTDLDEFGTSGSPQARSKEISHEDKKFFNTVEDDVHRILRKEKLQEEYKKHYAYETAMTSKYQEELSKKDEEVLSLRETIASLESELKEVKKRNKQLCFILGQGEMKDKAKVLLQVETLTNVRDELTEQVSQLTGELEKERSKVHTMKSELDRLKGSKHGGR